MRVQPLRRIAVLLKIGVIGYLLEAVAWALFWPSIAGLYFLGYLGFPLSALGLILAGLGCFALGKLYDKWFASVTGITYIATAVPFFLMNNLLHSVGGPFSNRSFGSLAFFIAIGGYSLLNLSLFTWAAAVMDIGRLAHHTRFANAIFVTSWITFIIILLSLPLSLWTPLFPSLFGTPSYVIAQILSAVFIHKISSEIRQTPRNFKSQNSSTINNRDRLIRG